MKNYLTIIILIFTLNNVFGQKSKYRKIEIKEEGFLKNDTVILTTSYNYILTNELGELIAYGNVDIKNNKAEGQWIFYYDKNNWSVVGEYKKGKMNGFWGYNDGCVESYKMGKLKDGYSGHVDHPIPVFIEQSF